MPISREEAIAELRRRGVAVPGQEGAAPPRDAGGLDMLGGGYKRNPVGVVYREGPKGGLTQVAGPNATQVGRAVESTAGVNAALSSIDRIDGQYGSVPMTGPLGRVMNPADLAVLKQSTTDLLMRMKETPYNLGVLNGPDLELMNQIVMDPNSVDAAVFRQKIKPLLQNLSSILGDQYRREAESFSAMGGRPDGLPALYRSPRSKFTPQEFGRQGRVTPEAMARPGGPPRAPIQSRIRPEGLTPQQRKAAAAYRGTKADSGTVGNPSIPSNQQQYDALPPGVHYIGQDGQVRVKQ